MEATASVALFHNFAVQKSSDFLLQLLVTHVPDNFLSIFFVNLLLESVFNIFLKIPTVLTYVALLSTSLHI